MDNVEFREKENITIEEKNSFYFEKLEQQIGKTITVGYIDTTYGDSKNVNEFSNTLLALEGVNGYASYRGLRIDGPGLYRMHHFISKDFTVVYIKDENGNIIYQNEVAQEICPVEYNITAVAKLVKESFGENACEAYLKDKDVYLQAVMDFFSKPEEKGNQKVLHKRPE